MASARPSRGTIYLIHFAAPVGNLANPRAQARHYLGWAADLETRLAEHAAGTGARLMAAVVQRGISFVVARTWCGTRADERALKNRKKARQLCPLCRAERARQRSMEDNA